MKNRQDKVWQSSAIVQQYLQSARGAIPLATEQIEVMMRLISARAKSVFSFLDLGCGDGILAGVILAQYPEAKGILLDFSEPMLKAAQEQLRPFAPNLDFVVADYTDTNWLNTVAHQQPFDLVVSGYSIHHQSNERKQTLYGEIYHLLKPGGLFINIEHVSSPTSWIEGIWEEYFIDVLYAAQLQRGTGKSRTQAARDFYEAPDREANILAPVELQCDWLRQIGFVDVDCYFKVFELAVFGGRRPSLADLPG